MKNLLLSTVCAACVLSAPLAHAAEDLPSREEMWRMIQAQQKQLQALQGQLKSQEKKITRTEAKATKAQTIAKSTKKTVDDIDPTTVAANGWWDKTSIGGYGETHYNSGGRDQIDNHRIIATLGHEFSEDVRFFSEIEFEHSVAGEGQAGDVVVEQAYVEFDLTKDDTHRAKVGTFLIPLGIINERHEPPTFYGVERNPIETNVIPSTYHEAGVLFSGNLGDSGFSYDAGAHSALSVAATGNSAFNIRSGRNKAASAEATDPAFTGRIRWSGYPGVTLGLGSQYQRDITQNANDNENVEALLTEAHADIRRGGWGLRALYARWDIDSSAAEAIGRDQQFGYYIEPSYRFEVPFGYDDGYGEMGLFARYNSYDNSAGNESSNDDVQQWDFGLNYWPLENVVLKADVAFIDSATDAQDDERLNLGIGYQF